MRHYLAAAHARLSVAQTFNIHRQRAPSKPFYLKLQQQILSKVRIPLSAAASCDVSHSATLAFIAVRQPPNTYLLAPCKHLIDTRLPGAGLPRHLCARLEGLLHDGQFLPVACDAYGAAVPSESRLLLFSA